MGITYRLAYNYQGARVVIIRMKIIVENNSTTFLCITMITNNTYMYMSSIYLFLFFFFFC